MKEEVFIISKESIKLIANNKKAYHDYFIDDKWEAGIELFGTEVKSIRMGKCSIKEAFVKIDKGEVYVQLPQVSTRSFAQRSTMKMGQTLVLAGFEQSRQTANNAVGIFNAGRDGEYGKTLLVITIELESAENV